MASNSFFNLAFLSLFSLQLLHPAFAVRRDLFIPHNHNGTHSPSPDGNGMCAIAVTVHGYKCQEYHVKTDDGYILSVQRIPEGRTSGGGGGGNRPPVLLQHGVLVDGMSWMMNSPEQSIAMILADNGFDVWIANTRGTRFSMRHVTLDPNNKVYWNWTWEDLMIHDLPSTIELVFKQTGQKVHYVGHSMGTLMILASLSERKVKNVKSAALLSPIAYLSHMTTPLGLLAAKAFVGEFTAMFGLAEFDPKGEEAGIFVEALCGDPGVNCYDMATILTGKNCCLNASTIENFLKHEPQPTATKNLVHFAQTARDGGLAKFDYGTTINLMHYGESSPPDYDLSKIPRDFPLFLSHGGQDALSDIKDVTDLLGQLKSHDQNKLEVQFIKDYAHADFIMGVNAKDILYNRIVDFLKKHN